MIRQSSRDMIARLVGFDTVSAKSNTALIDFAQDYLESQGARCRRSSNADGSKANLLASLGPGVPGGVVLSGHSDVVPVEGQPWDRDPFTLFEDGGYLYGRGTADMKSFLAIAMGLVPEFNARPLKRPIHLAFSYDEEVGCTGVPALIDDLTQHLPEPALVIVGEPTSMQIVNGHKGCFLFETRIKGQAAHSSLPQLGANAIMAAGKIIAHIAGLAEAKRAAADPNNPFNPPYTTFNLGEVNGGKAVNIVAQDCRFTWEFRPVPGEDTEAIIAEVDRFARDEVLPKLREFAPEASIETLRPATVLPLSPERDGAAETLVRRLTGANDSGVVSFGTEGGLFQAAGLSTVVFGPGSIDQAHQANEYIALEQVAACEAFMLKLRDWAAA
ncbi:acetylornithine deacetylase [Pelagibius litoralis]|uniref:Acetylornithine deacetylase n=1 Tax=Pelagibius litoralis TaxID=374515 RepID=A0A967F1Y4_9PROT|nr:acetylornithine deacetylase [Pelagibius litoralis]NIA71539.1 acetylornithine deacetylase [Pelagibius litoralis]